MAKPIRILIADDDPEDQEILREYLLRENPSLVFEGVLTGGDAVRRLNEYVTAELPEMIILDYKMPVLSAVEVLQRIRETPRLVGIPVLVWSTSDRPDHRQLCLAKGALAYFPKPATHHELISLAHQMLRALPNDRAEK